MKEDRPEARGVNQYTATEQHGNLQKGKVGGPADEDGGYDVDAVSSSLCRAWERNPSPSKRYHWVMVGFWSALRGSGAIEAAETRNNFTLGQLHGQWQVYLLRQVP